MIPRLKPYFNHKELAAAFSKSQNAVKDFEEKFADKFEAKYAVAFFYGRSGLYALLKCSGLKDSEVIIPAYTCVVVAHAVVYSGNIPKFVDISLDNYNMDLDLLEKAINDKTKAIVGTSLFGYPYDVDRLKEIIKRSGRDILLIQDCAHSLGAEHKGKLLCNMGDAALFSLSISKQISSIYGGIITTNRNDIYEKLRKYRDENFEEASLAKNLNQFCCLLAVYAAFFDPFYRFTDFLERRTTVLDFIAKYYREEVIDMPKDFMNKLPCINAKVGRTQLDKYDGIKQKRRETAKFYYNALKNLKELTLPPLIEGATYSHYAPRVDNREEVIKYMRKRGFQMGREFEYSIPHMKAYEKYKSEDYPNAYMCSRNVINLPSHPSLSEADLTKIVRCIKDHFTL